VGDLRAHDGADAEVEQGPRRVLARRPATEVVTADEDLRAAVLGPREHEVRPFLAVAVVAPVVEQVFAETVLRRGGQATRANDLSGVEAVGRNPDRLRANLSDRFHVPNP